MVRVSSANIACDDWIQREGNPFENPSEWTIYEILKLIFLFPLALVRGFLAICLLLLMLIIACLALIGAPGIEEDNGCVYHSEPFPESRRDVHGTAG